MTNPNPSAVIPPGDLTAARQAVELIRSQVRAQHIEQDFILRQLSKLDTLIEQVEAIQSEQAATGRFEALYNVSRMLGSSLDLQTVLDQVMDAAIGLTGAERGFLMLRDDDGDLEVKAARNIDQRTLSSSEFEYSHTITNYVLDNGEAIRTTNALEDPRFKSRASVLTQSLRSIMATPLWARGRVIGLTYVENRVKTGLFNEDDLTTLEALAGQASVAIDNAMLFSETDEKLARRVDELQLLRRIDMQLNEKFNTGGIMRYLLETACRITDATSGHIGLIQGDPPHIVSSKHYTPDNNNRQPVYIDDIYPQVWDAIDANKTLIFDTGQYGLHTVMIIPLLRENSPIGVLVLRREDGNPFSPEQRDLIERIVTRAAVSIENARLYAKVRAADRAKSEFVGIVAHDLKAPMTSIRGYADLMAMQGDNLHGKQHSFLSRISNTVKRMERLVNDLTDISRIESGQFIMEEQVISVDSVVEAASDTVIPQMNERGHTYIVNQEPDLPPLWVDYYRLVQVLTNLLTNACKYTRDNGTVTLKIQREPDADRICFSVSDTGIGLSEAQIARLGTKFWRAEDNFTRSQQGTGLGFAITVSLVEQMGSTIAIESAVGEGSTFTFSIAIATDEQIADDDSGDDDDTTASPLPEPEK